MNIIGMFHFTLYSSSQQWCTYIWADSDEMTHYWRAFMDASVPHQVSVDWILQQTSLRTLTVRNAIDISLRRTKFPLFEIESISSGGNVSGSSNRRGKIIVSCRNCNARKTVTLYAIFSERELKFMFAICHRRSVCLSVVCLSVCL